MPPVFRPLAGGANMRLASLILAGLLLAMLTGCSDKSASEAFVEIPPEAQVLLDELNTIPPETANLYSCPPC